MCVSVCLMYTWLPGHFIAAWTYMWCLSLSPVFCLLVFCQALLSQREKMRERGEDVAAPLPVQAKPAPAPTPAPKPAAKPGV